MTQFEAWPKMGRLYRDVVVTEKLDGTNAQVFICSEAELPEHDFKYVLASHNGHVILAGSRTRYITPEDDNFGFAAWVRSNSEELMALGEGRHYGEWWGRGIQRGYGMTERKFSLFNTLRWYDHMEHKRLAPDCCDVVPVMYMGPFDQWNINAQLDRLREVGSFASRGFMNPEGIIIYHTHARVGFKYTLGGDGHKGT